MRTRRWVSEAGGNTSPGFRRAVRDRNGSGRPMRWASASTPVQSTRASSPVAARASSRRQLLSRLPVARVRSISPPGSRATPSGISWRRSSAAREAFRSCSSTSSTRRPRRAATLAVAAARAGFSPVRARTSPGRAASSGSRPGKAHSFRMGFSDFIKTLCSKNAFLRRGNTAPLRQRHFLIFQRTCQEKPARISPPRRDGKPLRCPGGRRSRCRGPPSPRRRRRPGRRRRS